MTRSLKEKLANWDRPRRAEIEAETDRLHDEYLKQEKQRTTNRPT